jgi:hypothetical protein
VVFRWGRGVVSDTWFRGRAVACGSAVGSGVLAMVDGCGEEFSAEDWGGTETGETVGLERGVTVASSVGAGSGWGAGPSMREVSVGEELVSLAGDSCSGGTPSVSFATALSVLGGGS